MNQKDTLKNLFSLEYDNSGYRSGLIDWYNMLIDKNIDELTVTDVAKMIRQSILREVAVSRAVDLFLTDPYAGEMQDGELLALLVSCIDDVMRLKEARSLLVVLSDLEDDITPFDWDNDSNKTVFFQNLAILKQSLEVL